MAGYYDQPHMIDDFRAVTGSPVAPNNSNAAESV
jgi:hypothetical protein